MKLDMAKEEAEELRHGRGAIVHATMPPTVLIASGMDLELQQ